MTRTRGCTRPLEQALTLDEHRALADRQTRPITDDPIGKHTENRRIVDAFRSRIVTAHPAVAHRCRRIA